MSSTKRRGERDYLSHRNGVWYIRFQYPPSLRESACFFFDRDEWPKEEERSLKTRERAEAEALAQPYITRHKNLLLFHAARTDPNKKWGEIEAVWQMQPNTKVSRPNGSRSVATEETIVHEAADGTITSEPNRRRMVVKLDVAAVANEPAYVVAKKASTN